LAKTSEILCHGKIGATVLNGGQDRMANFVFLIVFIFMLRAGLSFSAESVKPIYIMTSSMSEKILPYVISQRLGFYRQEGFDVDVVLVRGSVAIQGIMAGSADYINHTSIFPAIMRGIPLRMLLVDSDKPTFYLVTSPKITAFKDLVGKTLAIDDFAGNAGLIARELLTKNKVPVNDVKFRVLGPPPYRLQALLGDIVDGTLLNYVMSRQAQARGYRIFAYSGDFISEVGPNLATTHAKIKSSPDEVYRVVKATLKGMLFMYQNPEESVKFSMEVQGMQDPTLGKDSWSARLKRSSETARLGRTTDDAMAATIETVQRQLELGGAPLKPKTILKPDDFQDFSFARRAYDELKSEGWNSAKYRYAPKK
jgi:NitT/TauT family transport system substrate-binding protein